MLQTEIKTWLTLRQSDILPQTIIPLSASKGIFNIYIYHLPECSIHEKSFCIYAFMIVGNSSLKCSIHVCWWCKVSVFWSQMHNIILKFIIVSSYYLSLFSSFSFYLKSLLHQSWPADKYLSVGHALVYRYCFYFRHTLKWLRVNLGSGVQGSKS